jgi:hypothetical protein
MKSGSLRESKRTLEEEFFHKESERKLGELREQLARQSSRQELQDASGISDPLLLDRLMKLGVTAETSTLLNLVPVIEVAWADGTIQSEEREAILSGAKNEGIAEGSPAHGLLLGWLQTRPASSLFEAWLGYVRDLTAELSAEQTAVLSARVSSFARGVAEAAGGFLGIGSVAGSEQKVLDRVEEAFKR